MSDKLKEVIHGKVDIQIGKNGLNDNVITQIKTQLKKRRYLKIRFLEMNPYEDMNSACKILADKTLSKIEDIRGKTCVIKKLGN